MYLIRSQRALFPKYSLWLFHKMCCLHKNILEGKLFQLSSASNKASEMDFKVGVPWNTEKYCRPPWLAGKKNFRILDALEGLKQ